MRWRRGEGHTYLYLTGFLGSRQQGREKYKGKSKGERGYTPEVLRKHFEEMNWKSCTQFKFCGRPG